MILDGLVAVLLFVTILYCWRLSRKISALNSNRKELQSIIAEFDKAIVRAETGVSTLKTLSQEADEQLQKHIEKARFLTNDLAFLTHKADNIAESLEVQVRSSNRASQPRDVKFTARPQQAQIQNQQPQLSQPADSPIMHKNLGWKSVNKTTAPKVPPKKPEDMPSSKRKALEEVLEQIAARKKKASSSDVTTEQPGAAQEN